MDVADSAVPDQPQYPPRRLPARELPVPTSISEPARGVLAMPSFDLPPWPDDLTDKAAVAATIALRDAPSAEAPHVLASSCFGTTPTGVESTVEHLQFGDLSVYAATPDGVTGPDPRVYLVIHGAWITGGGELSRLGAQMTAGALGVRTWAVDYRMPPYHPYPAPLDDCVAAYRKLLETHAPEHIAIGGTSGGGNLALATILRARDEGLPLPAAAVVITPYADMTHSGDSMRTNLGIDGGYGYADLEVVRDLYLDGHDPLDPYVSPVLADYGKGFPPTILTTGTRDFLLSATVTVHRRMRQAGVEAELHVWEAAPHFMFLGFAPEDHERNAEIRRFLDARWGAWSAEVGVAGPIPGEPYGGAPSPVGLTEPPVSETLRDHDYVEEEFFVSGTADGRPYTTSLLIRRPADAAGFSGVVVLEPVHVQGALGLWQTCHPAILAGGHVWVTVGSQLAAVEGVLKVSDPDRYASLRVPAAPASEESFAALLRWQQSDDPTPPRTMFAVDAVSNEIMTQVGVLLKTGGEGGPLPGFAVRHLIMGGASQTGMATLNYIDAAHPGARLPDGEPVYDGFLPMATPGWAPVTGGAAAVVHIYTEGDLFLFGAIGPDGNRAARPDSDAPDDRYRCYQVAAGTHLPTRGLREADGIPQVGLTLAPGERFSQFPSAPFAHAAFVHLVEWVVRGTVPPRAAAIEIADGAIVTDEFGNASGGIRSPYVDVPTARQISARYLRNLIGVEMPFAAERLRQLYGSRAGYLARFNQSVDTTVGDGWLLPVDGERLKTEEAETAPL